MTDAQKTKSKKYDYVEIIGYDNMPEVRLSKRKDFLRLMDEKHISTVYVNKHDRESIKGLSDFIFFDGNMAFLTYGYGYVSFEELAEAGRLGFHGSSVKYGLDEGKLVRSENRRYLDRISDGYVYNHVKEKGFRDFKEFEDSYSRGFYQVEVTVDEFRTALKDGFNDYKEYSAFKKSEFKDLNSYREAEKLNISDPELYDIYKQLEEMRKKLSLEAHDQVILYAVISSSPDRSIGLDVIAQSFRDMEHPLPSPYRGETSWYKKKYDGGNPDRIMNELSNGQAFSKLGKYDSNAKKFNKFIGVPVFLDGSNIAYNNGDSENGDKPSAKFLQMVIEEAKKLGFSDIRIYHDANLDYIVEDKELLKQLRKKYRVEKVPARTDADEFIIPIAKKYDAFVITNDQFRDYIESHKDDENYIVSHRLAFMIDEDQVIFNNSKYVAEARGIETKDFDRLTKLLNDYKGGKLPGSSSSDW